MKLVTARDVRAALIRQGSSCRSWAIARGFSPRTVQKCIQEHPPESKKKVRGEAYKHILRELSNTLGQNLLRNKADD